MGQVAAGKEDADACIAHRRFLGVCDGVSQVAHYRISPADLPRELLARSREQWGCSAGELTAQEVLFSVFKAVLGSF